MKKNIALVLFAALAASFSAASAFAGGFTETLPPEVFMLDVGASISSVNKSYDDDGGARPLINDIERYEPGGGLQGIIKPNANVNYYILINQLRYGVTKDLTLALGVPVVLGNKVEPRLGWTPGEYQSGLGRPYSAEDFWQWAGSMGQPKPGSWSGNKGVLADIILAARWRFTDRIDAFAQSGFASSIFIFGALPTGKQKDPEQLVAAGTTSWDLHSMGELGFHLSADYRFGEALDDRLLIGLDVFYEFLFKHTYDTPRGTINPLILNQAPYVGDTYDIDPGDFYGFAFTADVAAWKGPVTDNWLARSDANKGEGFPPILSLSVKYTFTYLGQSDWTSKSEIWDWEQEKYWRPGYKNILNAGFVISLLRVGAPMQLYMDYRNQSWIPGKNARAADVFSFGVRAIAKFW